MQQVSNVLIITVQSISGSSVLKNCRGLQFNLARLLFRKAIVSLEQWL